MRALIAREGALWRGETSPWAYVVLRVGLAALVLARTTDWLRPLVAMDHHAWSHGLDHTAVGAAPALISPLFSFLPSLGPDAPLALGVVRTALAIALLLGVRPRITAAALALVGYGMMALDRYRYFHHLHLLWLAVALLALAPSDARLSILPRRLDAVPRWPLQLVRAQVLVAYAAAGIAKLSPAWLSGALLRFWAEQRNVEGPIAALIETHAAPAAIAITIVELALVPLLAIPRARPLGIALAVALHAGIESSMVVSTFGATMLLLVTAFLPWDQRLAVTATGTGTDVS
jgi:hypothetical protein